jgi:hypothetical protein
MRSFFFQTTAATCQRAASYVDPGGNVGPVTSLGASAFSGGNIRTAVTINAAGDYVVAGITSSPFVGYAPIGGGSATPLLSGAANPRSVIVYSNTLFYSTAAPPTGIFLIGTAGAISTAGGQIATAVSVNGTYPNTSPSTFLFQSPSVLWVCDDGGAASYGVWKLSGTFGVANSYRGERQEKESPALLRTIILLQCSRIDWAVRPAILDRGLCGHRRAV